MLAFRAFGLAFWAITISVSKLIRESLEPDSDPVNSSTSRTATIPFGLLKKRTITTRPVSRPRYNRPHTNHPGLRQKKIRSNYRVGRGVNRRNVKCATMKAANRSKRITTQPVFMMAHLGAGYESVRIQSSLSNPMRRRRKAVQEQYGGSLPGTGFAIKDFQPLH